MNILEFEKQLCNDCETQHCCGKDYCGLYKRFILGEKSPLDEMMWAAKQQLFLKKLKEENK